VMELMGKTELEDCEDEKFVGPFHGVFRCSWKGQHERVLDPLGDGFRM
jgi:hypothetical protein